MFVWGNAGGPGESCSVGQYWKPGQLTVFVTQRRGDKREKGDISKKAVFFSSFFGGTVLRDSSPNVDTPTVFLLAAFHFLLETASYYYYFIQIL